MSLCAHRLEEACSFTPCVRFADGKQRTCLCGEEIKGELRAEETRVARVPDSAREGAA